MLNFSAIYLKYYKLIIFIALEKITLNDNKP
jgi:hypothetical protein